MTLSEANVELVTGAAKSAADNGDWNTFKEILSNAIKIERSDEREACAIIAHEHGAWARSFGVEKTCEMIAAAIRAKGQT